MSSEIVEAVEASLQQDGVLQSLRTQLLATIFQVMSHTGGAQETKTSEKKSGSVESRVALFLAENDSGRASLELVKELLETLGLGNTLKVFLLETAMDSEVVNRYALRKELNLPMQEEQKSPLLCALLSKASASSITVETATPSKSSSSSSSASPNVFAASAGAKTSRTSPPTFSEHGETSPEGAKSLSPVEPSQSKGLSQRRAISLTVTPDKASASPGSKSPILSPVSPTGGQPRPSSSFGPTSASPPSSTSTPSPASASSGSLSRSHIGKLASLEPLPPTGSSKRASEPSSKSSPTSPQNLTLIKLTEALSSQRGVEEVDFSNLGELQSKEFALVAAFLQEQTQVVSLNLSNNRLGGEGIKALCVALVSLDRLRRLNLDNNDMGVQGADALSSVLAVSSTLRSLSLRGNRMGAKGALLIASAALEANTISELVLAENEISSASGSEQDFIATLSRLSCLESINLSRNNLTEIDPTLFFLPNLRECNVTNNQLAPVLADASLTELRMFAKSKTISSERSKLSPLKDQPNGSVPTNTVSSLSTSSPTTSEEFFSPMNRSSSPQQQQQRKVASPPPALEDSIEEVPEEEDASFEASASFEADTTRVRESNHALTNAKNPLSAGARVIEVKGSDASSSSSAASITSSANVKRVSQGVVRSRSGWGTVTESREEADDDFVFAEGDTKTSPTLGNEQQNPLHPISANRRLSPLGSLGSNRSSLSRASPGEQIVSRGGGVVGTSLAAHQMARGSDNDLLEQSAGSFADDDSDILQRSYRSNQDEEEVVVHSSRGNFPIKSSPKQQQAAATAIAAKKQNDSNVSDYGADAEYGDDFEEIDELDEAVSIGEQLSDEDSNPFASSGSFDKSPKTKSTAPSQQARPLSLARTKSGFIDSIASGEKSGAKGHPTKGGALEDEEDEADEEAQEDDSDPIYTKKTILSSQDEHADQERQKLPSSSTGGSLGWAKDASSTRAPMQSASHARSTSSASNRNNKGGGVVEVQDLEEDDQSIASEDIDALDMSVGVASDSGGDSFLNEESFASHKSKGANASLGGGGIKKTSTLGAVGAGGARGTNSSYATKKMLSESADLEFSVSEQELSTSSGGGGEGFGDGFDYTASALPPVKKVPPNKKIGSGGW